MKKALAFFIIIILFWLIAESGLAQDLIEGFKTHLIKEGDLLRKIAPPEHWDTIMRVNRIDEKHLVPGKQILIPEDIGKTSQFCPVPKEAPNLNLSKRVLYFFLDIQYFAAYENGKLLLWGPISSGRKGLETPQGIFRVLWKKKDCISKKYKMPMPYAVNFSETGYFFHQQSLPGRPASHGCVRLLEVDAKKLFFWIEKNDSVILQLSSN